MLDTETVTTAKEKAAGIKPGYEPHWAANDGKDNVAKEAVGYEYVTADSKVNKLASADGKFIIGDVVLMQVKSDKRKEILDYQNNRAKRQVQAIKNHNQSEADRLNAVMRAEGFSAEHKITAFHEKTDLPES